LVNRYHVWFTHWHGWFFGLTISYAARALCTLHAHRYLAFCRSCFILRLYRTTVPLPVVRGCDAHFLLVHGWFLHALRSTTTCRCTLLPFELHFAVRLCRMPTGAVAHTVLDDTLRLRTATAHGCDRLPRLPRRAHRGTRLSYVGLQAFSLLPTPRALRLRVFGYVFAVTLFGYRTTPHGWV